MPGDFAEARLHLHPVLGGQLWVLVDVNLHDPHVMQGGLQILRILPVSMRHSSGTAVQNSIACHPHASTHHAAGH